MELDDWSASRRQFFFYETKAFYGARVHDGQLQVLSSFGPWTYVDLSTARFTDREGRDLVAIK